MTNLNLTQFPVYLEIPNINDVLHLDVKHKIARLEDTKASMD